MVEDLFGEAEVGDFELGVMDENVGGLDISVNYAVLHEIFDSFKYLLQDFGGVLLIESLVHFQVLS